MSILNLISVGISLVLLIIGIVLYVKVKKQARDYDGLCEINERGEIGTSSEGDVLGDA